MKMRFLVWASAVAMTCGVGAYRAPAQVSFSAGIEISSPGDFYQPLAASGSWVNVGTYGRCWRPARVPKGEPTAARSMGHRKRPGPGATATLASEGGGSIAGGDARPPAASGGATAGAAAGGDGIGPRPAST